MPDVPMSISSSMQEHNSIIVFGVHTYNFNILVFDHGAVNHCGADGGEIKRHMQSWQLHPEGAFKIPPAKPHGIKHFWSRWQ